MEPFTRPSCKNSFALRGAKIDEHKVIFNSGLARACFNFASCALKSFRRCRCSSTTAAGARSTKDLFFNLPCDCLQFGFELSRFPCRVARTLLVCVSAAIAQEKLAERVTATGTSLPPLHIADPTLLLLRSAVDSSSCQAGQKSICSVLRKNITASFLFDGTSASARRLRPAFARFRKHGKRRLPLACKIDIVQSRSSLEARAN